MDLSPTSSPIKPPRTIKFGSPNRGYCYIPYTPGLDEKSRIENELTNEIYDHIISSDLFSSIGLSSDSSKSEIYSFISKHFSSLPSRYCLDQKAEDIIRHMTLLNTSLRNDQALVSCHSGKVDNFQQSAIPNTVWITVVCRDRPKIFNRIIFALDKFILSTLDADIMTTTTGKVIHVS